MRYLHRIFYALALTAVAAAIFILVSAIFAPDAMVAYIKTPYWVVVVFVLAYLVAPFVGRYIKLP
jgi:hypothetical protein